MSVREAAADIGVSYWTALRMIRDGDLVARKYRGKLVVDRADLEACRAAARVACGRPSAPARHATAQDAAWVLFEQLVNKK